MKAPLSWLRDFAPFPDDVALLTSTLDDLGLVVEGVEVVGEGLESVVIASILEITAIEGADRVRRVVVDAGEGPLEIVCGATNFALGDLVPLAPVGAVLPGGFEIARRKMRGVVSNGMLCSGAELGLGDDHSGLLIVTESGASPGASLVEVLGVERDVIFDLAVEGNRPDAWCIAGVARDLAARLGLEVSEPTPGGSVEVGPPAASTTSVEVLDGSLCPRFALAVLEGVTVAPSPSWIARRLVAAGMRPINNVVDASNYVMLELGQPTHPYDRERVAGGSLKVRRARPGEEVVTLDGVTRQLGVPGRGLGDRGEDCVICDGDDVAIGIAGIMGGASSEISDTTTTVLLEAASFDPIAITRTARRLALRTEAAARFVKGSDPAILEQAIERFAELLALSTTVTCSAPPVVVPDGPVERRAVRVGLDRIESLLGVAFGAEQVAELLVPRGFDVTASGDSVDIMVPTNRPDIRAGDRGVADVIEEVARTFGYANLPRRAPSWPSPGRHSQRQQLRDRVAEAFLGLGADEAWTASLVATGELELLGIEEPEIVVTNPLSEGESRLRRSLLPGLIRALERNLERRQDDVALFEIGAVFVHPSSVSEPRLARAGSSGAAEVAVATEREVAATVLARAGDDARSAVAVARLVLDVLRLEDVRVVDAAGDVPPGLHPTRSARLVDHLSGAILGVVGEVDPSLVSALAPQGADRRVAYVELDVDALADERRATRRSPLARPVSRYPSSDLDLAFVVPDAIHVDDLIAALVEGGGALVESATLFDVYRGSGVEDGTRSLAVRCRLCAEDRTLDDAELASTRSKMIESAERLGATLR